jgi:hypothetical protein
MVGQAGSVRAVVCLAFHLVSWCVTLPVIILKQVDIYAIFYFCSDAIPIIDYMLQKEIFPDVSSGLLCT